MNFFVISKTELFYSLLLFKQNFTFCFGYMNSSFEGNLTQLNISYSNNLAWFFATIPAKYHCLFAIGLNCSSLLLLKQTLGLWFKRKWTVLVKLATKNTEHVAIFLALTKTLFACKIDFLTDVFSLCERRSLFLFKISFSTVLLYPKDFVPNWLLLLQSSQQKRGLFSCKIDVSIAVSVAKDLVYIRAKIDVFQC